MNNIWKRLVVLTILVIGIFATVSPPSMASPADDWSIAGTLHEKSMDSTNTAMAQELAFPAEVEIGLVQPATVAEIEALKTAWLDSERQYAELIKPFYEQRSELLATMRKTMPLGTHWQDPQTGLVFETVEPDVKAVTMEHYGIKRTALEGESSSGKLSKKRAVELGYTL